MLKLHLDKTFETIVSLQTEEETSTERLVCETDRVEIPEVPTHPVSFQEIQDDQIHLGINSRKSLQFCNFILRF